MSDKSKTIREKIQESISRISSTDDTYLGHENRHFGLVISKSGFVDLSHINDSVRGLPEVYFGISQILYIPSCISTEAVADFVEENINLFETLCEEIEVGYDRNANKVGKLSEEGRAAFERLTKLATSLDKVSLPTTILDPEIMFEAVRDQLGDETTPEDAIKVANQWAEELVTEYTDVRYLIDYELIEKYAVKTWHEFH